MNYRDDDFSPVLLSECIRLFHEVTTSCPPALSDFMCLTRCLTLVHLSSHIPEYVAIFASNSIKTGSYKVQIPNDFCFALGSAGFY